ncbi:MAG: DNA repair protein RecO [Acidimicrobiales bacterium]
MSLYRDQGVVLRTWRLGEADRIVAILTQGRGKVRAVVKGVRKTKSRFGARLEPLAHVSLQLYAGRELDVVTQAETIDSFRVIREDLDRVCKANTLLEIADQLAQEGQVHPRLYQMLVGGLRSLATVNSPVLVGAFMLRVLASEGVHPELDSCLVCGWMPESGPSDGDRAGANYPDRWIVFDLKRGGIRCASCGGGGGRRITMDTLELARRILGGQLSAALATPPGSLADDLSALAAAAMEHHLERGLRSLNPGSAAVSTSVRSVAAGTGKPPPPAPAQVVGPGGP